MNVDSNLAEVPVNILPLLDDTTFKDREEEVAYNATGLELIWHFTTCAGATTATVVTPTTGGNYDWAHQDGGMYTIEIPASGGASINNDTEGFGWFTGKATGVLPWRGPVIGFRAAALNNALINGGDTLDVNVTEISGDATAADNAELMFDGTGYAGGTTKLDVNTATIAAGAITAAAIATGAIDADAIADDAIDAAAIATGAIDADAIAADAISAAKLAADVTTEIQSGLATAAELAKVPKSDSTVSWNATALAAINAEVDAALNTAIPALPTADSINERIAAIDDLTQASGAGDLAAILVDTGTTLDALIKDVPTNAELGTALAAADDAVLAAIADVPTVAEFEARTLVAADYTIVSDLPSVPSAADIKTALEADGSKLDHLWEMTEDDVGVRRLTANALEQGPTGTGLDAAGVRAAVGLASANLDTQLGDLPTNAELGTALAGADDAVLAAVAALNNLSSAEAQTAATAALNAYDPPTNAEMEARTLVSAGYASPTNITAGTITTVTNLTNAPTNGDLTAAMKASVNAEVDAALNTAIPALPTADSINERIAAIDDLTQASGAGDLAAILVDTGTTLDALIKDVPTNAELGTALAAADDAVLAAIAALNDISVADIIAGVAEGSLDLQEILRIILAAVAGKSSGGGTTTIKFRNQADDADRITATVDENGNRTAISVSGA